MTIFYCKDDIEAMFTCIYDAWDSGLGHSQVKLQLEQEYNFSLFCEFRRIEADKEKAVKVARSIQKKISWEAYRMIYRALMSYEDDRLDAVYRFLISGFRCGCGVVNNLGDKAVVRVFELARKVANEAHLFLEFIRFKEMKDKTLVAKISPKCNVLTLVSPHFEDRMSGENWMIVDKKRELAAIHPAGNSYYLSRMSKREMEQIKQMEKEDEFVNLWKTFFHSVSIKERENPVCQRNMLPLWYREHMTEFM